MTPSQQNQADLYAAYADIAVELGDVCNVFRASGPTLDLTTLPLFQVQAAFDTDPLFSFKRPSTYSKPLWYGGFDPTAVCVGDYIMHPALGTFFVASKEPMHPPMLISCNAVVSVSRPAADTSVGGILEYGGDYVATEQPVMTGWPCSIITKSKGEVGDAKLPGDTRAPWAEVLMPALDAVRIRFSDILTDANGTRYIVSSTELTDLGWRMLVQEAVV